MPFKTPPPTFDPELVADIEDYLDQAHQTEITYSQDVGENQPGLRYDYARGRVNKTYSRPVFQVIDDRYGFEDKWPRTEHCQCFEFHLSWNCDQHPERTYDSKIRGWRGVEDLRSDAEIEVDDRLVRQAASHLHETLEEQFTRLGLPVTNPLNPHNIIEVTYEAVQQGSATTFFTFEHDAGSEGD